MRKDSLIKIILVLLMIGLIIFVAKYISKLNTNKMETHELYQYFGGKKVEYKGNLEISRQSNGIAKLQIEDIKIELDSTPIYYQDIENKILFPQDMAIVFPMNNGNMQKINYFSTVELKDNRTYLQYEEKEASIKNAFLFDGADLYVFLEPVTLTVGEETYELSALSYVIVNYRKEVEFYQKNEDKYTIIEEANYGNVTAKTSSYEINLSTDSLTYSGREQLLLKKIDILSSFDFGK